MLIETQTVIRYKHSFSLLVYRLLDMVRMAPSSEIQLVLKKEVKFLYGLLCLIVYNESYEENITALVEWAAGLGSDIKLDTFKIMFIEKLNQIHLRDLEPKNFLFTFSTIWDTIHFLCMIGDDIVMNRHLYDLDEVWRYIRNLKWVFYNVFIVLFCPICAKHYLTINNFPYEFERVEVALYREKMGEPIQFVDEIKRNQSHKNLLFNNYLLYKSMLFHNHVNSYRPIQHVNDELNQFQRMEWPILKNLLGIN
ncbi:P33; sulfhydryloxidase [Diatraea saccharalis granulovirus]|uniref:p33 sulfhydryloxidase n=1 Tax=Diatraea saccharalis granulovirus TaxID=1675862 RepID=A0A0R7EYT2_9BBAC|nr:P33; sulfhydryloxidase [Diatraea saccharalis granulovirus]AKN80742.1 P33; sulfhydryloxidase [Diatraea saccharalis granulovirus]